MSAWSRFLHWLRPVEITGRATAGTASESSPPAGEPPALEASPVDLAVANESAATESVPDPSAFLDSIPSALPGRRAPSAPNERAASQPVIHETPPALPQRRLFAQFDRDASMTVILEGPEEEVLWSIARRIETGRLDLPTLPSTSMSVIELANNPSVEFQLLVAQISTDPVLSSELLRTANSAMYAGQEPVDTLQIAIVRIGLRALRSMIFSVSMRGTILRSGVLAEYAEDVWRHSYSVATLAREIAPPLGVDPEKAFLLGLLQDIGKISLLAMLSKSVKDPLLLTPNLIGRVFQEFHQQAGAAMARKWKLPDEFASVAGCHHDWAKNTQYTRSAALANLAYRLDLAFSQQDESLLEDLRVLPALLHLAPQEQVRERILEIARATSSSTSATLPV